MADEKKEGRINIDDLPQAEQELTPEEAKEVKGGYTLINTQISNVKSDTKPDVVTGAGLGGGPHVKGTG